MNSKIKNYIGWIANEKSCEVIPAHGQPKIEKNHYLPTDLIEFYTYCGGVKLFQNSSFTINISSPETLCPANPEILVGLTKEQLQSFPEDRSWSWYTLGRGENGQYITIDLQPKNLGSCYDAFWDLYPSDSPLIAKSFTELLAKIINHKGERWYWK